VALFLGSWWALQEGSWGGWWNWDPSEFFGLIILYLILSLFHNKSNMCSNQRLFTNLALNISYLFTFFLLLQLNFSLISHNFGFRNLKFLNIEILLFSYLLLFLYMFCTFLNSAYKVRRIFNSNCLTNFNFQFVLQVILIFFNLIVLAALLSFFLKTLLSFKFFFSFISFNKLLVLLFLCFYIKLFYLTINSWVFYINVFLQNYYVIFYVTTLYNYKLKYLSHYLIFLVVVLNLLHKHNILNDYIYVSFNDLKTYSTFLSLNNREIELFLNFFSTSSTFESKSFNLEISKNYLYQIYFISNTNWHFSVTTVDSVSTIIHTLTNLLVVTFLLHFTNRSKFY
jgi:cytochrome c biogenesis factor